MMEPATWTSRTWSFGRETSLFLPILERLRGTPARAEELVHTVDVDVLTARRGGKWSGQEHLGHLADLHEIDDRRLTEFLQGEPVLTAADMTNAATERAHHNSGRAADVLERLRRTRMALVQRLESLSIEDVQRSAIHPRLRRRLSLVDWMFFTAEHDDHHLAHARYAAWRAEAGRVPR